MLTFRQKQQLRAIIRSRILLVALVFVCVFFATEVFERFVVEREMVARRIAAEEQLRALEAQRARLEEQVDALSDERGVEAEIRKNFDVAKAGEQVVVIMRDDKVDAAVSSTVPAMSKRDVVEEQAPWYYFWR